MPSDSRLGAVPTGSPDLQQSWPSAPWCDMWASPGGTLASPRSTKMPLPLSGPQRGSSLRTDPTSLPHGRCCGGTQPCGQPLSSTRRCHTQGTAAGSRFSRSWLLWPPRQGLPFLSQRACRGLHGQDYTSGLSSHKTIYLWRWIPRQLSL